MIHEIGRELQAALRAKGCPFPVVDADAPGRARPLERIVIEHDEGGDSFGAVRSQRANPKHRFTRSIGAKLTIYARSRASGANPFEHRRRAETVLDLVLCALHLIASTRGNAWAPGRGRFITAPDAEASERHAEAIYELPFTFDRAVMDRDWAGDAQPEGELKIVVMTGEPDLTFTSADDGVTRSAGSWIDDGFEPGMVARINGSPLNSVASAIVAVTASVMTLEAPLADEGPVSGCSVHVGGVTSTTIVLQARGPDGETPSTACGA